MSNTLLKVFVKPNARTIKYQWLDKTTLKIDIPEPPEKNKANEYLIKFLSEKLSLPQQDIEIKGGKTSRHKFVIIKMELEKIKTLLGK
ncbi:MAG: UPF0235 protein [Bacteroidia bacterium]|nr:MAG: UPF0235 protein [Bacteroidia bacterium]